VKDKIELKGVKIHQMITVNKRIFKEMVDAGIIRFGKYDKNFTTINRKKKSRRHKYAVVETKEVKTFFKKNPHLKGE